MYGRVTTLQRVAPMRSSATSQQLLDAMRALLIHEHIFAEPSGVASVAAAIFSVGLSRALLRWLLAVMRRQTLWRGWSHQLERGRFRQTENGV